VGVAENVDRPGRILASHVAVRPDALVPATGHHEHEPVVDGAAADALEILGKEGPDGGREIVGEAVAHHLFGRVAEAVGGGPVHGE
jgi:hypothetical protein